MAKYVCDYDQVKEVGDKLITTATNMQSSVASFSTSIESDLSSWSGAAKENFDSQTANQVEIANQNATKIREAGEYIKESANAIEELDNELAGLRI